jgi:hypothetical protein
VAPPAPPIEVCLRAAYLWSTGCPYTEVAEILRREGYDGRHPPLPRCGSHQTAINWAARGRRYAEEGENYAAALDRDDGRLVLADALLKDIAAVQRSVERDQLTMKEALDAKRWLYREFSRLIGGDAPTLSSVTVRTEPPAPDPAMLGTLDATLDRAERDAETAAFERAQRQRAAERRADRNREDEGA